MGCHSLLEGIILTQGLNWRLLHWQADSLPLSLQGNVSPDPCPAATPTRAVNNFESGTSENGLICNFMKRGLLLSWTASWSEQLLASCSATDLWNTTDKGLCLLETRAKERKGLLRCVLDQVTPQHPPKDAHLQCPEPVIIFLTWQRDLAGVMTVRVFTMGDDPGSSTWASLIARILGEGGRQAERRKDATGLGEGAWGLEPRASGL